MLDTDRLIQLSQIIDRYGVKTLLPVSDPRPGLDDRDWREWSQLRHTLATGSGVKRKPMKLDSVQRVVEAYPHVPGPRVHVAADQRYVAPGSFSSSLVAHQSRRIIDFFGSADLDEHGDPIQAHPGEIDIEHYRRLQRARQVLDYKSKYTTGYRTPDVHVPLFGHDRFRTLDTSPYFEDRVGFIRFANANATRHNAYSLER